MTVRRPRVAFIEIVTLVCLLFAGLPVRAQLAVSVVENPAQASVQTAAPLPIVFVPGTAGTELRITWAEEQDQLYWIGRPTLKKKAIKRAALGPCGEDLPGITVNPVSPLTAVKAPRIFSEPKPIYTNFLAWARAVFGENFYEAPYDWRKGAGEESSARLERVIDEALQKSKQDQVIIVAHSLGGLVSRDYIMSRGGNKVAALIAIGTPWLGTPKTVRALLWGYNFGAGKVVSHKGKIRLKNLPEDFTSSVCEKGKCQRLESVSLLKLDDVRTLARNFPSVYQQLPTEQFMIEYGKEQQKEFKGVIWGRDTWKAIQKFYVTSNSCLFDQTQTWRSKNLRPDDKGVTHYLVGGIYSPECKTSTNKFCDIDNRMDMQMADVTQVSSSAFSNAVSALIRLVNIPLWFARYGLYRDRFVAIDSDYHYGDGTAPLLSATAGEFLRDDKPAVHEGSAKKYLGTNTQVQLVTLGPKYGHSAMLDDPHIRTTIGKIHRLESEKRSRPTFQYDIEEVTHLAIRLTTVDNGTKNTIQATLAGDGIEFSESEHLTKDPITFKKLEMIDPHFSLPREKKDSKLVPVTRALLTSDLARLHNLVIRNNTSRNSGRTLRVTGVEVFVNGKRRFILETPFELAPGGDRRSIPLTL